MKVEGNVACMLAFAGEISNMQYGYLVLKRVLENQLKKLLFIRRKMYRVAQLWAYV